MNTLMNRLEYGSYVVIVQYTLDICSSGISNISPP